MTVYFFLGLFVTALVTYLPRALPLSLVNRPIRSRFLRSCLYYVPYAVLGAMTVPAILYSTSSIWSAAAGLLVALALSYMGKNLLPVALSAASAVFLVEWALHIYF